MGMFAFRRALTIPFAAPALGLPADRLERGRELCQAPWEMPTALGWLPVGPGAFKQGTPRMGLAGLRQAALLTPRPTGIVRGRESELMHELSGGLETRQGSSRRHGGHGARALDTAQSLARFDHWRSAPGFDLRVAFEFQTAQTFRLCGDGLDVCLKDELLRRGGAHPLAAPAQGSGTPGGPPRRADSVPQEAGCEPQLGGLQLPEGLCPCPTQVAARCIVDGGDRHGRQGP